ncbi:thiamine-phosphate kinase [Rickettsiales bacterium]|nr:thiamine-phosphate kinase [Rickettsiales bacterium]
MDEFSIIEKYFSPLASKYSGALGLKDDAAIVDIDPDYQIITTKDILIEGVHFFAKTDPALIAKKLLRVNLSDLAAMGAEPVGYLLGLALNKNTDEKWISEFSKGLKEDIDMYGGSLIGGDTTCHDGNIVLSLTALGKVKKGRAVLRSNAKIGDDIYVTGTIGDSYLGLNILNQNIKKNDDYLVDRYHLPQARVKLSRKLHEIANSATDISDGLIADLGHICKSSNVGAKIYCKDVPLSDSAKSLIGDLDNFYEKILTGGDDYEIIFTSSKDKADLISNIGNSINLPIKKIGEIAEPDEKIKVLNLNGSEIKLDKAKGYQHF